MGGFFLTREPGIPPRARRVFHEKGLTDEETLELPGHSLTLFSRPGRRTIQMARGDGDRILVAVGPVFYRGAGGLAALARFLEDFCIDREAAAHLTVQSCLICRDGTSSP